MKRTLLALLIIFAAQGGFAQKDPKAKSILDDVAKQFQSYKALKVDFKYVIHNMRKDYRDTIPGTFYMKGEKYKLFFMGNEVFYDGKTLVTLMPDANEATITQPPENTKAIVNPAELFTVYNKDFKYSYREKFSDNRFHAIDLYPENVSEKKYSRIRVKVTKDQRSLHFIKKFDKAGKRYLLLIEKLDKDVTLNKALFTFEKDKYPGVEIIDLRK